MAKTSLDIRPAGRFRAAFTLIEITIVLAIIGLLLAAIWTAAGNVSAQKKGNQAVADVFAIVQGVRALYSSVNATGAANGIDETGTLFAANIFPSDMGGVNPPQTPWPNKKTPSLTTVMVTSQTNSAANVGAFEIELNGVPSSGCVALLFAIAGASADPGLFYVNATTTKQGAAALSGAGLTFPVTTTSAASNAANNACNAASAVSVQFAFNLH